MGNGLQRIFAYYSSFVYAFKFTVSMKIYTQVFLRGDIHTQLINRILDLGLDSLKKKTMFKEGV